MKEVLLQWGGPGGLLVVLATLAATSFQRKGAEKTPAEEGHKAELAHAVEQSGVEEHWRSLFEEYKQSTGAQLDKVLREVDELKQQRAIDSRIISTLYGYGWRLRAQLERAGHTPYDWPPLVDPNKETP